MQSLDRYAYASRLMKVNPLEKLILSISTMLTCLLVNDIVVSIIVLLIMAFLIVAKGKVQLKIFVRLLLIPSIFILASILAIIFSTSNAPQGFLLSLKIVGTHIGITRTGIILGIKLFLRTLGAVSCLYFLSLTTPMIDVISTMRRLKIPALLLELMSMIYRLVFIFIETADAIFIAQSSRLGYSSMRTSFMSFSALVSALFLRSYHRAEELYIALEARGYDGELKVLEETHLHNTNNYIGILILNMLLAATSIIIGRLRG